MERPPYPLPLTPYLFRMKIYTKTGDAGETGLFGGGRVPKDHIRVQAYGDVDELNSAIGVARATQPAPFVDTLFERTMDEADAELPALKAFVLPAGTPKAAALHLARTVCRRAERSVIALSHEHEVPEFFIVYLNRLSDLLFTLARQANHRDGKGDVTW